MNALGNRRTPTHMFTFFFRAKHTITPHTHSHTHTHTHTHTHSLSLSLSHSHSHTLTHLTLNIHQTADDHLDVKDGMIGMEDVMTNPAYNSPTQVHSSTGCTAGGGSLCVCSCVCAWVSVCLCGKCVLCVRS